MMKKLSIILLALALLLLMNISSAPTAGAAAGSFAFQYYFDPKITGEKGGNVSLTVEITNTKTGTKEINWFEVKVNTHDPFKKRKSDIHLHPQESTRISYKVPFQAEDVDVTKKLTISVGTDQGFDETRSVSFEIKSTQDVLHTGLSISKTGQIYSGDKVKFKFKYKNEMESGKIEDLKVYANLVKDGDRIAKTDQENLGDVSPGDTVNQTLIYTFKDADTGDVDVNCHVSYSYLGRDYTDGFKLKTVNIEGPAATEAPSPTATETPSPTVSVSPSPTVPPSPSPTVSPSPSAAVLPSPSGAVPTPDTAVQANSGTSGDPNTWLYVAIAAAGVLVTGVTAVLIRKKKPGKQ